MLVYYFIGALLLQVESLWNVSLFAIESLFFRLVKIFLADLHSAFTECQHTGFRTDGLDVGPTQLVAALNELFQVHLEVAM